MFHVGVLNEVMQRVGKAPREAVDEGDCLIVGQMVTAEFKGECISVAVHADAKRWKRSIAET
jgi:hypothetical protein